MKHHALYWNGTVYEITGDTPNRVQQYECGLDQFKEEHTILVTADILTSLNVSRNAIAAYTEQWCIHYPAYALFGANCQLFVQDIAREVFQVAVTTQKDEAIELGLQIANFWYGWGSMAIVAVLKWGVVLTMAVILLVTLLTTVMVGVGYSLLLYNRFFPAAGGAHRD